MKKESIYFILIILAVIGTITIIMLNNNEELDRETAQCIADKSTLYVSKTCTHCAAQKEILKEHLELFTQIDCTEAQQKCINDKITAVPTWIINNQQYTGLKSIKQLKQITNC